MLQLKEPSPKYIEQLQSFRNDFLKIEPAIPGGSSLEEYPDILKWIHQINNDKNKLTVREGYVPALTYLYVDTERSYLLGIINIRLELNSFLKQYGGHIGYSIRPDERRKGYAKQMLKLALNIAHTYGLEDILITADDNNIASYKTIEANKGILENKVMHNQCLIRRYWISNIK